MSPPSSVSLPVHKTFLASAIAASTAEIISLPLDNAKVTLQLQPKSANPHYRGLVGTTLTLAREQGIGSLYKGLSAGLQRQILFGGLRIGMYEPVKALYVGKDHQGDVSLGIKIAAGLTTGALGIAIANPTDLVKVRMQAAPKLAAGQAPRYPSAIAAYGIIIRTEGVKALWTGLAPNMARNAIVNAAELASYDQIKETLLASGLFKDNVYCHIASGLGAGFFAVCAGSPVDVVKSRMMGSAPGTYTGVVDAFAKTLKVDGPLAFYSGFGPNFARLGTWNVMMFLTLEQVKHALA